MTDYFIDFTVPGAACGKGRPIASTISGRVRMRTPPKTAAYEGMVAVLAQQAMRGRPLITSACSVVVDITHKVPQSFSRAKTAEALVGTLRPCVRPDVDNVLKAIGDGCNGVLWDDDDQITDCLVRRRYGLVPSVRVRVTLDPLA